MHNPPLSVTDDCVSFGLTQMTPEETARVEIDAVREASSRVSRAPNCSRWIPEMESHNADHYPHDLPASIQDFNEPYVRGGVKKQWSRVWNFVPRENDYTAFVRAAAGTRMALDPLCEVGCPYAVRGFDYDYVGILWLEDLQWRNGRWSLNLDSIHESGVSNLVNRARNEREASGPHHRELTNRVTQAYRILLTRPLKGAFLCIPDRETREYVEESMNVQDLC